MPVKLGILTIGQTPRPDYEQAFRPCLPPDGEMIIVGALDDLTLAEIQALPLPEGAESLATLSREGVSLTVAADEIHHRMPAKLRALEEQGVSTVVVGCTGDFSFLTASIPLLLPSIILTKTVTAVAAGQKIVVVIPLAGQADTLRPRWEAAGFDPVFHTVSPFSSAEILAAAGRACAAEHPALIVLDCMGFSQAAKEAIRAAAGIPVVAAQSLLARVTAELVG